jgi:hypothetical protein
VEGHFSSDILAATFATRHLPKKTFAEGDEAMEVVGTPLGDFSRRLTPVVPQDAYFADAYFAPGGLIKNAQPNLASRSNLASHLSQPRVFSSAGGSDSDPVLPPKTRILKDNIA